MRTVQLIRALVADLGTPSGSVAKGLFVGVGLSLLVSFCALALFLGIRPDLDIAVQTPSFWLKAVYTFAVGSLGLIALERLGRPAASANRSFLFVGGLVALAVLGASGEIAILPALRGPERGLVSLPHCVRGSWRSCLFRFWSRPS